HDVRRVGRLQDARRQASHLGQIAPDWKTPAQAGSCAPPLRQRPLGTGAAIDAQGLRKGGGNADEPTKDLPDLAEIEVGIEMLHQIEHVALRRAMRVPPATAVVVDDDDLALAAAVFQGAAGAAPAV